MRNFRINHLPDISMKPVQSHLQLLLLAFTGSALAYVPPNFQGDAPQPSVRPVSGPIRPNVAATNKDSGTAALLRPHLPVPHVLFVTKALFWGKGWLGSSFSKDKIRGIDLWFDGYMDSNYERALRQHGPAEQNLIYRGHTLITDPVPSPGSEDDDVGATTSEICKLIDSGSLPFIPVGTFFPVYLAKKRAQGGACAVNVVDTCSPDRPPFAYAIFYNLDGDSECDPGDHETGHSQGLSAIANATARAVAELRTDWDFRGFYDESGNEVDDKCAWTFNVPYVTFTNGSIWKLQGLWSNSAYEAGTGYPNAAGVKGCVDGH